MGPGISQNNPFPKDTYSDVFWVDTIYGNNTTAVSGRFDRPFLTVAAAISAATGIPNSIVWIRHVVANLGTITLIDGVNLGFDFGSKITCNFTDGGVVTNCNIQADGVDFVGNSSAFGLINLVTTVGGSNVSLYCRDITGVSAATFVNTSVGPAYNYAYVQCRNIDVTNSNAFAIGARGFSNTDIIATGYIQQRIPAAGFYRTVFTRNTFVGTINIKCKEIRLTDNTGAGNGHQAIYMGDESGAGVGTINFEGDIINSGTTTSSFPVLIWARVGNIFIKNSKIITGNLSGFFNGYNVAAPPTHNGKIFVQHSIILCNNFAVEHSNELLPISLYDVLIFQTKEVAVISYGDAYAGYGMTAGVALTLNLDRVRIKETHAASTITVDMTAANGAHVTTMTDVVADSANAGANFCKAGAAQNARFNNVRSNVDNDANYTDLLVPSGFIYDTNTLVPIP